ncbi:MAG: HlyD family secretion protein [Candidatus Binatia bacterium]
MTGTRRLALFALVPALVVAVVIGGRWWEFYRTHVQTDDAYVHAAIALVTPRIAGTVSALVVDENWQVRQGDLLARLDPAEYRVRLRRADAALARAATGVEQARAAVRTADGEVTLAETDLAQARLDHDRAVQLAARGVITTDRLDHARTALRAAEGRLATAQREGDRARATLGITVDAPASEAAAVREAQAARDEAALMLSWTRLRASVSGVVARRSVEVGQRVQPGQALMAIVPVADAWIEANFKETQLTDVRVGQHATVVADLYPGVRYEGRVDGIAPGTGAAFALLPPENATGNWVKVVQRLPIRIRLDPPPPADRPLRVGLSVEATIDTADTSGPLLTPFTQATAPGRTAGR